MRQESFLEFESLSDYYLAPNSPYVDVEQEHLAGGGLGLTMFKASQHADEFVDPPLDQLILAVATETPKSCEFDFGDGWKRQGRHQDGSFVLQPPNQECRFRMSEPHSVLVATLSNAVISDRLDQIGIRGDPFAALYGGLSWDPTVLGTVHRLWDGLKADAPANALLLDGLSLFLLGHLIDAGRPGRRLRPPPRLDDRRLARIVDYIEAHHASSIAMADLAGIAAISTAHLPRAFRKTTGQSPHAYLTGRRIEHARQLLRMTNAPITQIAFATGFGSPSHFATVFRNHVGCSPSAFRQTING